MTYVGNTHQSRWRVPVIGGGNEQRIEVFFNHQFANVPDDCGPTAGVFNRIQAVFDGFFFYIAQI
ncbi:hypothetical protein WBJ53_19410 [Spirosoma sp. SC4-14]|uniref:hypothetical protein n=1 Tax=Spirosoma sp. SC4-14 TaxID=3128900 RepID=UPI0030D58C5C